MRRKRREPIGEKERERERERGDLLERERRQKA